MFVVEFVVVGIDAEIWILNVITLLWVGYYGGTWVWHFTEGLV